MRYAARLEDATNLSAWPSEGCVDLKASTDFYLARGIFADSEPDYLGDKEEYDEEDGDEEDGGLGDNISIISKARDLQIREKDDVVLPCETEGDNIQIIWLKDKTILFTDMIRSGKDKRYERLDNGSLKISKVTAEDTGNYTCQIAIQSKPSITHQLKVLIAPRIVNWNHGLKKTLNKGESLSLSCSATGYPQPSISWSRKQGRRMPNGEETIDGDSVTFEDVSRKHGGVYECLATNNVGDPATSSVEVEIKYAPEIEIEKAIVNSGEGSDAELVCEVHADPRPKVGWFKDGVAIAHTPDKFKISHAGSKHLLTIINTQKSDFGNYTCHANNSMGRVDKVVRLSGEPSPARYISGEELENGQKLNWLVESHSPVSKFTLKYRNRKGGNWMEVHPPVENPEGNLYSVEQNLELTPGEYEAILLSENTYGWSDPSIPHLFNYTMLEPGKRKKLKAAGGGGILLLEEQVEETSGAPSSVLSMHLGYNMTVKSSCSLGVESDACLRDIEKYKEDFQAGAPWALRMFDSATKMPSGILDGNVLQMGNYDECLSVQGPPPVSSDDSSFTGLFCRVKITELTLPELKTLHSLRDLNRTHVLQYMHLPLLHYLEKSQGGDVRDLSLQWAACAPSTCGAEGLETVAEYNLNLLLAEIGGSVQVEAVQKSCFAIGDGSDEFDPAAWGLVGLASFICLLVVLSSAYDYYTSSKGVKPANRVLLAFSAQKNLTELFYIPDDLPSGILPCLNGIRVLSLCWVLLGHRYHVQTDMANINALQIPKVANVPINMIMLNAYLSVETFFLLSGLLVAYTNCIRANKGQSFNLIQYYVNRYVRLTVPLALLVYFLATMSDKVVRGPLMDLYIDSDAQVCRDNWWATLLYVNNYVNNLAVCGGQTWYLTVDMQLALLAPIIIFPLIKWPKPTMYVISFLTLASVAAAFATTYINELFWTNPFGPGGLNFWLYLYSNTPMRAAPFLVGMGLGYILSNKSLVQKMRLTTWQVYVGWVLNTALCLAVVFTLAIAYQDGYEYDKLEAAFYGSLHRLGWSLGIAWVIFACTAGYGGEKFCQYQYGL
ncbi:Hypothetical predicted protein [Cloeon dipterum]|uniref:Ig-like domain-containing protein n=1 Tax=Cloeon dipterum TaxID=197152 RepID=A0A8S1CHL8_9INSE|nr:Hypothetical predicted protein [Cloeon dipterum]